MNWIQNIPEWLSVTGLVAGVIAITTLPYQLAKKRNETTRDSVETDDNLIDAYERMKTRYMEMLAMVERLELELHEAKRKNRQLELEKIESIEDVNEALKEQIELMNEVTKIKNK